MNLLRRSLLLILITLALFLNAARNDLASDQKQEEHPRQEAQSKNDPSHQVAASERRVDPKSAADTSQPKTFNYYGNFNYDVKQGTVSTESVWHRIGDVADSVSAVLVAIFTFALVCTSLKQWRIANENLIETRKAADAAKDAADASKASARAADASLHIYRPFLIADAIVMTPNLTVANIPEHFQVRFRNRGIGPADILRVQMEGEVFPWNGQDEPFPEYNPADGFLEVNYIVAAGKKTNIPSGNTPRWFDVSPEEFNEMRAGTERLGLHGIVVYRGGPEKEYWTRFFWWYLVDSAGRNDPLIVLANRPDVNAHT